MKNNIVNLAKSSVLSITLISACYAEAKSSFIENSKYCYLLKENRPLRELDLTADESKADLWQKYLKDVQKLTDLKAENSSRALKFGDKVMRFSVDVKGDASGNKGKPLYIALHGGGEYSPSSNDVEWEGMKVYYKDSVDQGVYVAPRGISNTWKLHWEDESFALYDKLIENMVLFEGVDPNRVYFLGFSAGGDGVYQVVPRMADRFAAANTSAGHHNGVKFDNLYNTPFLTQVGEFEWQYDKNRAGVENYLAINALNEKYGGGYIHDLFLHVNGSHNTWQDNSTSRRAATVIANPEGWLSSDDRTSKTVNSNAIDWLKQYTRNPHPEKIVWDLSVGAPRPNEVGAALIKFMGDRGEIVLAQPNQLFYWLDVSVAKQFPATGKLVVEALKSENAINVIEVKDVNKFRILLSSDLLNLAKPITIKVNNISVGVINTQPNLITMTRTMLERSDKNYIFESEVTLEYNAQTSTWNVINSVI